MTYPRIPSAKAMDAHTLVIEFNNKQKNKYDITPLLEREVCAIKNPDLFKAVQVEQSGYAVVWNNSIDISGYELWSHGQAMP